jgi:hypothetical protein
MAWEKRKNTRQRYYYRSKRLADGSMVKEYHGTGECGAQAADADRHKRAEQSVEIQRHRQLRESIEGITAPLAEMCEQYDVITQAALLAAGFHRHKGEWRKRRHGWHSNED